MNRLYGKKRGADWEDGEDKAVLSMDVRNALKKLTKADQELLLLRYVNEMPVQEIGKLFHLSRFAVRRRFKPREKHMYNFGGCLFIGDNSSLCYETGDNLGVVCCHAFSACFGNYYTMWQMVPFIWLFLSVTLVLYGKRIYGKIL